MLKPDEVATSFQERGGKLLPAKFHRDHPRRRESIVNLSKAFGDHAQHYDKRVKMRAKCEMPEFIGFVLALAQ